VLAAAMRASMQVDAVEVLYPLLATMRRKRKPHTSHHRYTLTFTADQLPPRQLLLGP